MPVDGVVDSRFNHDGPRQRMKRILFLSLALTLSLSKSLNAQLPQASADLVAKLGAWELEQQAALQKAVETKRAEVAALLEKQLQETSASGNLEEALAIRKEIERLSPATLQPASAPPAPGSKFPADAVEFKGRHYKVLGAGNSWSEAKKQCSELKGRLAMPASEEENTFLMELAKKAGFSMLWLGASDERREGKWISEGKEITYTNWDAPDQPNNAGQVEHFAVIHSMTSGLWWDFPDDPLAYPRFSGKVIPGVICQWDE